MARATPWSMRTVPDMLGENRVSTFVRSIPGASFFFGDDERYASDDDFYAFYNSPKVQKLPIEERYKVCFKVPKPLEQYSTSAPLLSLLRFDGGPLQMAMMRSDFWLLITFHIVIASVYFGHYQYEVTRTTLVKGIPAHPGWPKASFTVVSIVGSLVSLALVFYVSQTYSRWFKQYELVGGAGSNIEDFVFGIRSLCKDSVSEEMPLVRAHIVKLSSAALLLGFACLPQNRRAKIHLWAYDYVVVKGYLTPNQVEHLKGFVVKGDMRLVFIEIISWLMRSVSAQGSKGRFGTFITIWLLKRLFEFRSCVMTLFDYTSGPIPFAYYHLLNLLSTVYLFILGYTLVFAAPWTSIPVYVLIVGGFITLKEIGDRMSDPLGDDDTDLPIFDIALGTIATFEKLLVTPTEDVLVPPFEDGMWEQHFARSGRGGVSSNNLGQGAL